MTSDMASLEDTLTKLLQVMVMRLPKDKRISAGVVQQLLRSKYTDVYPEEFIAGHGEFITTTIDRLMSARSVPGTNGKDHTKGDHPDNDVAESDADEESDEDIDEDESEEEEDDGDVDGSDEDEESSDEVDDDDDDEEDDNADDVEPSLKKRRQEEEVQAFSDASANSTTLSDRCKAMVECLRKLHRRPRLPEKDESLQVYLDQYLIPEFTKQGLDPERYSKDDVRRYIAKREVELLQQDGASINLDRTSRVGRGFANVSLSGDPPAAPTAYKTSQFLDDDE